jgi:hypothetical protein
MTGRIPRILLTVGIVTAPMGCDNVSWGGLSVRLEAPSADTVGALDDSDSFQTDTQRLDYGPLLYAGVRQGDSATVTPVAQLVEGRLVPLPLGDSAPGLGERILEERMAAGTELTLFHQGARIGRFTVSMPLGMNTDYCPPRPGALGRVELVPSAHEVLRFLALEKPLGGGWLFGSLQLQEPSRALANAAQNLAGEALNQLRAPWPAALQDIRRDLQVIPMVGRPEPALVATFLFQDRLDIGPAPDEAYALLVLGEANRGRFQRTFTWFRRAGTEGKAAPRFFSSMDWDGDGQDELLYEVFGSESRWWLALKRTGEEWSVEFQDPCGQREVDGPSQRDGGDGLR